MTFMDDNLLIQMYKNWIEYVKETVPKDQLLVFNAKDGVDKIADFLGRSTPDWKLPHMNGEIIIKTQLDRPTRSIYRPVRSIGRPGILISAEKEIKEVNSMNEENLF